VGRGGLQEGAGCAGLDVERLGNEGDWLVGFGVEGGEAASLVRRGSWVGERAMLCYWLDASG
jgi:hypothetical protein